MIQGVSLTPLSIINTAGGDVMHAMKSGDDGYAGFGEAYFSCVEPGAIKAWKRHRVMTLNLIVPVGRIEFALFDDRVESETCGQVNTYLLSPSNYQRLSVPPGIWMGFKGLHENLSMLLNLASIRHQADESDRKSLEEIQYNWLEDVD